ncbi:MAG: DUF541 domain-containing protein [Gammaproteobacteria bacterium]|nr:SIMPL domain-containing protein [Gemmatimonadota bacterium]NIU75123.1 DUF541 domain-containing protein [Gammaproteobacteria bacterium]NIY09181.1 DUF541 domain-containing protein [Gemmatimonadota bacterium]
MCCPILRRPAGALLGAVLLLPLAASPAAAQYFSPARDSTGIMASGFGEVTVAPGRAVLYVALSGRADSGTEALAGAASTRGRALAALDSLGIDAGAVTLAGVGYGAAELAGRGPPRSDPGGERLAQVGLRVEVDSLGRLDPVLLALADAGMEAVLYVELLPEDRDGARREAVRRAIADARLQAESMAAELGVRLGRMRSAVSGPSPGDLDHMTGQALRVYPGQPFTPSRVTVGATVYVSWEVTGPG